LLKMVTIRNCAITPTKCKLWLITIKIILFICWRLIETNNVNQVILLFNCISSKHTSKYQRLFNDMLASAKKQVIKSTDNSALLEFSKTGVVYFGARARVRKFQRPTSKNRMRKIQRRSSHIIICKSK
jgi:hypothetical protein